MTQWFGIEVSDQVWFTIELIPIILAISVIFVGGLAVGKQKGILNIASILSVVTAFLLILAQGSWMTAHLNDIGYFKTLADNIWTIFNSLVMTTFLIYTLNNVKK